MRSSESPRRGFTLIELLVVIVCIGALALLLIPAVQASRESARKAQCVNRLKQIGLAVSNFESVNRHFPSTLESFKVTDVLDDGWCFMTIHCQLLPYLEQKSLFDTFNTQGDYDHPVNSTIMKTSVETFLCPTDRHFGRYCNNYRANVGYDIYRIDLKPPSGGIGAFRIIRKSRASEFTDGLSTTVGWSERLVGNGDHSKFDRSRDIWFAGMGESADLDTSGDELLEICALASSRPAHINGRLGE